MSGTEVDVVTGEIVGPHPYEAPQRDTFGILGDAVRLAEAIYKTQMVPEPLRGKPDAVVAVVLAGHELGLGPMQSLQTIDLIQGRPALSPEGMRALILAEGHGFDVDAQDDHCTVICRRRDWPPERDWRQFTFTMADAERAGLAEKDNWVKYPRAMLTARATGEAARAIFADVIAGLSYTSEEVADFSPPPAQSRLARPDTGPGARQPAHDEDGACAVEGADQLVATLKGERQRVQASFGQWRRGKKYPMPPETPEQLADMQSELAKIRAEEARDESPVGSPID
jgi:hypothetical protein